MKIIRQSIDVITIPYKKRADELRLNLIHWFCVKRRMFRFMSYFYDIHFLNCSSYDQALPLAFRVACTRESVSKPHLLCFLFSTINVQQLERTINARTVASRFCRITTKSLFKKRIINVVFYSFFMSKEEISSSNSSIKSSRLGLLILFTRRA